jgi:biotin carboxyl carrier protein
VRKIVVTAGQKVEAGQTLLMVEAMKMEFAIKSSTPGTVVSILVEEGMILTPGQKLLDFE